MSEQVRSDMLWYMKKYNEVQLKSPVGKKPKGQNPHGLKAPWSKAQPLNSKMVKSHIIPEGLEPLVDYFDATYISGTYRKVQRPPGPDGTVLPIRVRKTPPLFPPDLWIVNIQTMSVGSISYQQSV